MENLSGYLDAFVRLRRHNGNAPHKPLLLLALIDEIDNGAFSDGLITLSPELVVRFREYWKILISKDVGRIEYPFRHLYQEGFWHFVRDGVLVSPESRRTYSLLQLRSEFDGVRLSVDLWVLMQDQTGRSVLRQHLLDSYFAGYPLSVFNDRVDSELLYEAEQLKREAEGRFRIKRVQEKTETFYIRHTLFPRVIRGLYDDCCAVCRLSVRTSQKVGLVEAAHILPFSEFHNDDPRNGIALCKNHHWGFDAGWFSLVTSRILWVYFPAFPAARSAWFNSFNSR